MDLKDKIVVITGAASGIGLALAQKFVQEGARVVASDLSAERGQAEADRLGVRFVPAARRCRRLRSRPAPPAAAARKRRGRGARGLGSRSRARPALDWSEST